MWLIQRAIPRLAPRQPHGHGFLCALLTKTQARQHTRPAACISSDRRGFTSTATCSKIQYPPRPKPPPDEDITEVYLKGSGPGGQKINKTSSAVQLKHIPTGIVVKCQETRSRSQNRKLAREHLAEKIDDLLNGENSRSAVVARINARKKASAHKKSRRKHQGAGDGNEVVDVSEEKEHDEEGSEHMTAEALPKFTSGSTK